MFTTLSDLICQYELCKMLTKLQKKKKNLQKNLFEYLKALTKQIT